MILKILQKYKGPILIFVIIIFANILFLSGTFKSNPIDMFSGLVTFTHSGLFGLYSTIDPNNAYSTQALGHAGVTTLLHGHIPWWNYNEQVGAPLVGGMQSASLFFPFNLILALSNGVIYFHIILDSVAGIATFYLLKRLRCSDLAAILGGCLFALNGTISWFGSPNVNPIAFLPLLILGIEVALSRSINNKKGGWFLITIAIAFSIYSGFPEAAYLDGLLAGLWFLVRVFQLRHTYWKIFTYKVVFGLIVGLLLSTPILVAFIDYLQFANVGTHTGALSHYSLPLTSLSALIMPYIYGPIFQFTSYDHSGALIQFWDNVGGYLSISAVFLAIISIFSHKRKNRAIIIMLSLFSLIVIGRIYGFPGLSTIFNIIPGMREVAVYRYVNPTIELAIIILAMFGLDSILSYKKNERPSSKNILSAGLITLGIVIILIPLAWGVVDHLYLAPHHRLWLAVSVLWSLGVVCLILLCIFIFKKYLRFILPVIILIDVLIMFIIPQLSSPRSTILDLKPLNFLQANLGNSRFYSIGYIMPNYGSYYGIASINTNNEPVPQAWYSYISSHLNSNVYPAQEFTGIDMLTPTGITPVQALLKNLSNYEAVSVKYVVIRNGLLPREIAPQYSMKLVYSDNYYSVYQLANPKPYFQDLSGICKVLPKSRDTLDINCSRSSSILRRELYAPGWTAKINNIKEPVYKSGPLFQEIAVPKGHNIVKFNYTPPHMIFAYVAFGIGILLLIYNFFKIQINKSDK